MATPVKLKLLARSTIKAKSLTRFPADVVGADGVTVTQSGASYTIGFDPSSLTTFQPLDNDLTAIAALTGTGILERDGDGDWSLNTALLATGVSGRTFTATSGSPAFIAGTLNVKAFGAIGDGVTDDTTAIQNAINASGFGQIYFPAGTYSCGELTGASNKTWVGDGTGITTIQCRAAPTAGHDWIYFLSKSDFGFRGITFDGNGNLTAGAGNYPSLLPCMYLAACFSFVVEECEFIGFYNCGLLGNSSYQLAIKDCIFTRAAALLTGNHALALLGTGTVDGDELRKFLITGCKLINANMSLSGHDGSIINNIVTGWGFSAGINTQALASNFNLYIAGNKCYDSNQAADSPGGYFPAGIENWAANSIAIGNDCSGNWGSGIDWGGKNGIIIGNVCTNNGNGGAGAGGISLYANDATFLATGTLIIGNRCTDTRAGGARTQAYGYYENVNLTTYSASNIVVGHNNFEGNLTSQVSLQALSRASTMAANITIAAGGFTNGEFTTPTITTSITPTTNDGAALGTNALQFSDLFLASGGVINLAGGDVSIVHSANLLSFLNASNGYRFDGLIFPAANDGAALGTGSASFSDLFLASGAVVNFNNGDVTLTHSTDTITLAGGAASTSTSTGALVISGSGGLGVAGEVYIGGVAWTSYSPVATASTGTFTTVSATGKYKQYGKLVAYYAAIVCTTVGTAAGRLIVTLPTSTTGGGSGLATGINSANLKNVSGIVEYDANGKLSCVYYDGTFPITTGQTIYIAGMYEAF